jgi:hypothetical protein
VDLARTLAADVFTAAALRGPVRGALAQALDARLRQGDLDGAADVVEALVDTWPVASLVDDALADPSDDQLDLLGRASEIVRLAFAWPSLDGQVWPRPPDTWLQHHAGPGPHTVQRRGPDDGAAAVAEALGCDVGAGPSVDGVLALTPEALVARRGEVVAAVMRGEHAAVAVLGAVETAAARMALGEVRMEASRQQAYERYGRIGLTRGQGSWRRLLGAPLPGVVDGPLEVRCLGAVLPGPPSALRAQEPRRTGWLLWDGPHPPRQVTPRAAGLATLLGRGQTLDAVTRALESTPDEVAAGVAALRELGALSGQPA